LFHHAEVLVANRGGLGLRVHVVVAPQVRTTHARAGDEDDRVGVLLQHRDRPSIHPDVSAAVPHYASHTPSSPRRVCLNGAGSMGPLRWVRFYRPVSMGPLLGPLRRVRSFPRTSHLLPLGQAESWFELVARGG